MGKIQIFQESTSDIMNETYTQMEYSSVLTAYIRDDGKLFLEQEYHGDEIDGDDSDDGFDWITLHEVDAVRLARAILKAYGRE